MGIDDYEIYAHGLRGTALTVGATAGMAGVGPFVKEVDLNSDQTGIKFGDHATGHTLQFLSANIKVKPYWRALMREFGR